MLLGSFCFSPLPPLHVCQVLAMPRDQELLCFLLLVFGRFCDFWGNTKKAPVTVGALRALSSQKF